MTDTGGRWDPATDSWSSTSTVGVPEARHLHTAVWSGSRMIVWGGYGLELGADGTNTGGCYDPAADAWAATSLSGAPSQRMDHTAVWTGTEMTVWGGVSYLGGNTNIRGDGGRYSPASNSWQPVPQNPLVQPRYWHSAVWTGSEMVVWGGRGSTLSILASGGRWSPPSAWSTTSTIGAPESRLRHTAVWTGTEMVIWGGVNSSNDPRDTGGRYQPQTDSWLAPTLTATPSPRSNHSAVWTGTEMIIWGGVGDYSWAYRNTGGEVRTGGRQLGADGGTLELLWRCRVVDRK